MVFALLVLRDTDWLFSRRGQVIDVVSTLCVSPAAGTTGGSGGTVMSPAAIVLFERRSRRRSKIAISAKPSPDPHSAKRTVSSRPD